MADNQTSLPKQAGKEIGESGTLVYQGIITNEDYNRDFTGSGLIRKVEIMRRSSSTVRGTLLVVKLPILGADWQIKAATNPDGQVEDSDEQIAAFVRKQLFEGINFTDFLRQALTHFDFGFSVFEKMYGVVDYEGQTRIGLKKLGFRKQRTIYKWEMDDGNEGIHQIVGNGNSYDIPREKLIIFTNEKEGDNYEGMSLLRFAYKDWDMLDKLTIVNAVALEKQGIGVPIVQARDGETPSVDDVDKAEEIMRNFRANEEAFIAAPSTMTVEMMDMKGNTTKEIIPTLNYHDTRIAKSVLAGFMEIGGSSGSGSQALSRDLSSFFMKAEEASAKSIQSQIQDDIVKQLCDFNFSPENMPNGYPQITFGSISDDNLVDLANSLSAMADKKLVTPDIELEAHIRKVYKLPDMSEEAKASYEKRQETMDNATINPPTSITPPADTGKQTNADPTLEQKPKPDQTKVKASLEEAQREARKVRSQLIDAVTY